jgi:hypothetical protein
MRCSYYPQSLVQVRGAIREIEIWIWGVDPRVLFIPSCPGYTGLIGALDRFDRCKPLWDLPRVNCLTRVSLGLGAVGLFGVVLLGFV